MFISRSLNDNKEFKKRYRLFDGQELVIIQVARSFKYGRSYLALLVLESVPSSILQFLGEDVGLVWHRVGLVRLEGEVFFREPEEFKKDVERMEEELKEYPWPIRTFTII